MKDRLVGFIFGIVLVAVAVCMLYFVNGRHSSSFSEMNDVEGTVEDVYEMVSSMRDDD